jgi:hypothetical protein
MPPYTAGGYNEIIRGAEVGKGVLYIVLNNSIIFISRRTVEGVGT